MNDVMKELPKLHNLMISSKTLTELGFSTPPNRITFNNQDEQRCLSKIKGYLYQDTGNVQLCIWEGIDFDLSSNDHKVRASIRNGKVITDRKSSLTGLTIIVDLITIPAIDNPENKTPFEAFIMPGHLAIINIYPDEYKALGFTSTPDRLLVKHTGSVDDRLHFAMNIYQEDNMVQLVAPENTIFYLKSETYSLAAKIVNGKLVTELPDSSEPENLTSTVVIGRIQILRLDIESGRIHPEVEAYIRSTSDNEAEVYNKINAYKDRLIEDKELGDIVEARKDQKRIRVDVDKL